MIRAKREDLTPPTAGVTMITRIVEVPVTVPEEETAQMVDKILDQGFYDSRFTSEPLVKKVPGVEPRFGKAKIRGSNA